MYNLYLCTTVYSLNKMTKINFFLYLFKSRVLILLKLTQKLFKATVIRTPMLQALIALKVYKIMCTNKLIRKLNCILKIYASLNFTHQIYTVFFYKTFNFEMQVKFQCCIK